jgi:pantetheine-phosphate adenylyltransferase
MSIICVTGPICSGKSTAVKMLKHRLNWNFLDLDDYAKTLRNMPLVKNFLQNQGYTSFPDADSVVRTIIPHENIYKEFCAAFEPYLFEMLNSLEGDWIIEASALFAYPSLNVIFDGIISISIAEHLQERNRKTRQVSKLVFDTFNTRWYHPQCYCTHLHLQEGTLLELRGKIEECFIIASKQYSYEETTLLQLLEHNFKSHQWNYNYYHNKEHTRTVITDLILRKKFTLELGLTALFHDIGYLPKHHSNEEFAAYKAVEIMQEFASDDEDWREEFDMWHWFADSQLVSKVQDNIFSSNVLEAECPLFNHLEEFFYSDLSHFTRTPAEIIETEQLIFKEYQFYDWNSYKDGHTKILKELLHSPWVSNSHCFGISLAIGWISTFQPRIAWFCGSFNPLTIGHYDIIEKAKAMFDKVVIVQAYNPMKQGPLPIANVKFLNDFEIITTRESIPKLLNNVGYIPTLVRGIRNFQDVQDTQDWVSQIKHFTEVEFECIMISGDPLLNHVSSSFVRHAKDMGADVSNLIIS